MLPGRSTKMVFLTLNILLLFFSAIFAQDDFTHEALLDAPTEFWLRWSFTGDSIDIAASAKTLGWLAFGLTRNGGMDKADVMFAYVNSSSGRANVSDRYLVVGGTNVQLLLDRQQDWELLTATRNATHTSIRVRRKLETCDPMDYSITQDTIKVIYSLDQQQPTDFLHPTMHDFRGQKSVLFLDESLAVRKLGIPIRTFITMEWNVLMDGVIIPESVTSRFHCKLIKIPSFNRKFQIVKVAPKIDPENVDLVRQILVSICSSDVTDDVQPKDFVCGIERFGDRNNLQQTSLFGNCTTIMAAWAIGASSFVYPDDVGYPIGPELSGRYVLLQTQYVNSQLQRRVDSSGVNLGLSDKLRKNEAGILSLGVSGSMILPPVAVSFMHYGQCSGICTRQGLPEEGITMFAGSFHSNGEGKEMKLRQVRDGVELPSVAQDNNFDATYQEIRGVYPARKLLKGDQLTLECSYSSVTPDLTRTAVAVTDEICFGTVFYYPRINMTTCQSAYPEELTPLALGFIDAHPAVVTKYLNDSYSGENETISTPVLPSANLTTGGRDLNAQLSSYTWTIDKVLSLRNALRDSDLEAICRFENGYDASELVHRTAFVPMQAPNSTCAVVTPSNAGPQGIDTVQPAHMQPTVGRAKSAGNSVKIHDASLVYFILYGMLSLLFAFSRS